ncbi:MAG: helix-turn-helix transcriptional regulator [Clostridia bacterium]|nr:helix-turn-helix transcriptional regulator [Clostridia bacterium]
MNTKFTERLKELRTEKDINQVELSAEIGVSKGIISLWENGLREPGMYSLIQLAKFFDVSIDYLVGISDYPFV